MPMINLPSTPTSPTLGKSSSAISQGYIDSELQPFVNIGGAITQDPGSISVAGQSKLGRHIFLKSPEEQSKIMNELRTSRLNTYVNERLGEGFSKASINRLQRQEGNVTRYLDIDWGTGNISESTSSIGGVKTSNNSLSSKFNVLQGIQSGKIQASSAATEKLKTSLGLSNQQTTTPEEYSINNQGYSVSSSKVQAMADQIMNNSKSSASNNNKISASSNTPSYANGGLSFSNISNVNASSNLNKALGTTQSNVYKASTPTSYATPKTIMPQTSTSQKVTSILKTSLSNTKIGQATKAISNLIKKK